MGHIDRFACLVVAVMSELIAGTGKLVLVVGPSGSGKDTLISWCRSRLADNRAIVFPRRIITRPAGDVSEDHEAVSEEAFARRVAAGAFAIHWRAHGLGYGVSVEIEPALAAGQTIVVNVSRSVIDDVRSRFQTVLVVSITARREIIAQRLRQRGREDDSAIDRRLARGAAVDVGGPNLVEIDNSGPVEQAGAIFLRLISGV